MKNMVGVFCGIAAVGLVAGCTGWWERAGTSEYGMTRAERICHPYGNCMQGVWVADGEHSSDLPRDHAECLQATDALDDQWFADTVSQGLEVRRCMAQRGYRFVQYEGRGK